MMRKMDVAELPQYVKDQVGDVVLGRAKEIYETDPMFEDYPYDYLFVYEKKYLKAQREWECRGYVGGSCFPEGGSFWINHDFTERVA